MKITVNIPTTFNLTDKQVSDIAYDFIKSKLLGCRDDTLPFYSEKMKAFLAKSTGLNDCGYRKVVDADEEQMKALLIVLKMIEERKPLSFNTLKTDESKVIFKVV